MTSKFQAAKFSWGSLHTPTAGLRFKKAPTASIRWLWLPPRATGMAILTSQAATLGLSSKKWKMIKITRNFGIATLKRPICMIETIIYFTPTMIKSLFK
jgi:hypothetical protein